MRRVYFYRYLLPREWIAKIVIKSHASLLDHKAPGDKELDFKIDFLG